MYQSSCRSQETFFVHLLGSKIESILESCFFLTYKGGIQPSEVDNLTLIEVLRYEDLLRKELKDEMDIRLKLAGVSVPID